MHNKNPPSGRLLNPNFRDLAWKTNILFTNARMDHLITEVPLLKNLIQAIMMWEAGTNYNNAISQRVTRQLTESPLDAPATNQDIFYTVMFNYILVDIFASTFGHGKTSASIQRGVISSVMDLDNYHLKDWTVLVSKAHRSLQIHTISQKEITALSTQATPLLTPTAEMPHLACFKLLTSRYDVTPILRNFATATFNLCILLEGNLGITKELMHGLCSHERRFLPTILGTRNFEIPLAVASGISPICLLIPIAMTLRNISKQDIYKIWQKLGNDRPAILREVEKLLWLVIIRATLVPDQLEVLLSGALDKAMDLLKGGVEEECKCWLGAANPLAFGYTMASALQKGKDGQHGEVISDFPNKKLRRNNETDAEGDLHEPRRLLRRAATDVWLRSNSPAEQKSVVPAVQPRKPSTSNQMVDTIDGHIPLPPSSESHPEFPLSPFSSLSPSPCTIELDSRLPESPSLRIKREIVEIESYLLDSPCPEQKHEEMPTPLLHYLPPPTTSAGDFNHSAASHPKNLADRGPVEHGSLYLSRTPPSLERLPPPEKNYKPTDISATETTKAGYPVSIASGSSQHSVTRANDSEAVLDISPDLSAKKIATVVHGMGARARAITVSPYPHAVRKVDHPQTAATIMEAASNDSNKVRGVDKRIAPNKATHGDSRLLSPTSQISVLAKSPQANPSTDEQAMELGTRSRNIHAPTREAKGGSSHSSNTYDPPAHEVSMILTATRNDWSADNRDAEEVLSGYSMMESNSVSTSKRKDDKLVLGRLFNDMEDLKLKMKKYEERNTELELEVHRLRVEMDDRHPQVVPPLDTEETTIDVDMEEPPPRKVPIRPVPPEIPKPPLDPPASSLSRLQPKHTDVGRFSHPLAHLFIADFEFHKTESPVIGVGMPLGHTSVQKALLPTPDVILITPSPRSKPDPPPIRAKRKHHVFVAG